MGWKGKMNEISQKAKKGTKEKRWRESIQKAKTQGAKGVSK